MMIIFLFQQLPRLLVKTNGMRTDVETKRKMENVRIKGNKTNGPKMEHRMIKEKIYNRCTYEMYKVKSQAQNLMQN